MRKNIHINKKDLYKFYVIERKTMMEIGKIYNVHFSVIQRRIKKFKIKSRNCKKRLCGIKFNRLLVIKESYNKKKDGAKWKCVCDCGNIIIAYGRNLQKGNTQSCGCLKKESIGNKNPNWKGVGCVAGKFFAVCKNSARIRKIKHNISSKYLYKILEKQNFKCALTGDELWFDKHKTNASIDRIDSNKGYVKNNIQWVTIPINIGKGEQSQFDFICMCFKVVIKQKRNEYYLPMNSLL